MTFENIKQQADELEKKIERVESVPASERRAVEQVVFTPKDFHCDFKAKEIKYYNAVKIFFENENHYRLFLKHFNVAEFIEPNVHNIETLVLFLKLLEEGIIKKETAGNKTILKVQGGEYVYDGNTRFW